MNYNFTLVLAKEQLISLFKQFSLRLLVVSLPNMKDPMPEPEPYAFLISVH